MNIKPKLSPRPNKLLPEANALPVWRNIASQHSPTMQIKPITQSTGKRLRSSTENKTILHPTRWIEEAVHIRNEGHHSVNRDEGSCQLSHAYDRFPDATADHHIKTQKNWVPSSSDEDLVMRSKHQNKVDRKNSNIICTLFTTNRRLVAGVRIIHVN